MNKFNICYIHLYSYSIEFSFIAFGIPIIQMEKLHFINGNCKRGYIIIKDESEVMSYRQRGSPRYDSRRRNVT